MAKTKTVKAVQGLLRKLGKSDTTPVTIGGRQPPRAKPKRK